MAKNDPHQHPDPEPDESLEPKVRCEVCMTEIPRSEARSAEGTEYVRYFCGLDCYEKWLEEGGDEPAGGTEGERGAGPS